jgi:hypothetical protein
MPRLSWRPPMGQQLSWWRNLEAARAKESKLARACETADLVTL